MPTQAKHTVQHPPTVPTSRERWRGYLYLFAGMGVAGSYVAMAKPLTAEMPVFLLAWMRFMIAAVAMLPWLRPSPLDAPIDRGTAGTLFLQSFFGNFLFTICMLYGVSMTSASAAGVILSTLPAAVALASWWLLRERLTGRTAMAVGFAVAGITILTLSGQRAGGTASIIGNFLVIGSVVCEAMFVILGKKMTARMSPKRIAALINLCGLVLMTPMGIWQAIGFDFGAISPGSWLLLVYYALSASTFSVLLWLTGQKTVPANQAGVFTIAMPLAATAVGVLFLGEALTVAHVIAFACASIGIALVASNRSA